MKTINGIALRRLSKAQNLKAKKPRGKMAERGGEGGRGEGKKKILFFQYSRLTRKERSEGESEQKRAGKKRTRRRLFE